MRNWIATNGGGLLCNGAKSTDYQSTGAQLLSDIYHAEVKDWPKFFKMDGLSKLGFICSELLLREEGETRLGEGEYPKTGLCCFSAVLRLSALTGTISRP